ncbi:MAG TPA: bifunctional phosphoglucose/phosphomannose isomerase [Bacteroidota bacterium]|nr:bifunctional phosphoglucose/phosphomannose isomerase [Bacteroidota bacterium]
MTHDHIAQFDRSGMFGLIAGFPRQIEEAVAIGEAAHIKLPISKVHNIVVSGLGGSAIGGDLLRSYLADEIGVPIAVSRHYFLPKYVDERSLVVISSYSGNTEETISSLNDAGRRKAKILCITSGGEVKRIALKKKYPLIEIPGGLPPRAALGYSFFPTLIALSHLGFYRSKKKEISETVSLLKEKSKHYGDPTSPDNKALRIAETLHGKLPVVYSSADRFDTVNVRWRGQFSENAKILAYGHVFPELNHNEIVGWEVLKDIMKKIHVIILRDKGDHGRVRLRMDITKEIIREFAAGITELQSEGESLLARMFSLLYLGDWVSFYLAILNGVDPTPVKKIDYLKESLGKVS